METLAHLRQQPHSSKAYWPLSQHVGGSGHWCRLLQIYCDDDDQYDNDGINVGSDYQIAIVKEHEHWPLSQHVGGSGHWCRIAQDVNVLMMRMRLVQGGDDIGTAHEIDCYKI